MEIWKPIPGAQSYMVSNEGRIKSIDRYENSRHYKGKLIKGFDNGMGYTKTWIRDSCGRKMYVYNHRVVAEVFVPNPYGKPCVNHLDNNPTNNNADNLEWCTHQENMDWSNKQGRNKRTPEWLEHHRKSHEPYQKSVVGTNLKTGETRRYSGVNQTERDGFQPGSVSRCCNGLAKTHKGYSWEFE